MSHHANKQPNKSQLFKHLAGLLWHPGSNDGENEMVIQFPQKTIIFQHVKLMLRKSKLCDLVYFTATLIMFFRLIFQRQLLTDYVLTEFLHAIYVL